MHEFLEGTDFEAKIRMSLGEEGVANMGLHARETGRRTWTVLGTAKMWP